MNATLRSTAAASMLVLVVGCDRALPPGDDGPGAEPLLVETRRVHRPPRILSPANEEPAEADEPVVDPGEPWWTEAHPCPAGASVEGKPPPEGSLVRCVTSNGVRHGRLTSFSADGRRMIDGTFNHDREHGVEIAYHPSGHAAHEGRYYEGERVGHWTGWHANGAKAWEGAYAAGRKHGRWLAWYPSGNRRFERGYRGGLRHGRWTEFHENGRKQSEGSYDADRPYGTFTYWSADGEVERVTDRGARPADEGA